MPTDTIIVASCVTAAFAIFAIILAYVDIKNGCR